MLKCIITFYDHCQKAIAESPAEKKVTWAYIKTTMAVVMQKVIDAKFMDPKTPVEGVRRQYDAICKEIEEAFQAIGDV